MSKPLITLTSLFLGLILLSPIAFGETLAGVKDYLDQGSYDQASKALLSVVEQGVPGESALLQSKLADSPVQALDILNRSYKNQELPFSSRAAIALEIARLQTAAHKPAAVIAVLQPLVENPEVTLPGEVHYLLGLGFRSLGQLQKAREMLASVKPSDKAFAGSRFFLGEIGLQQNDATLALHYFEAALKSEDNPKQALAQAGRWKALRHLGEDGKASSLFADLQKNYPGSLALLEIQGQLRGEEEEIAARMSSQPSDQVLDTPAETSGRYSLQLGAFSDRGLALELKRKYADRLPDLRVDEVRDAHGQFMYKLRLGNYANPAQARTDAKFWSDKLDTEVIVTDLGQ